MENIHYYIYIYRDISEPFDCSIFKRQLSEDFVIVIILTSILENGAVKRFRNITININIVVDLLHKVFKKSCYLH